MPITAAAAALIGSGVSTVGQVGNALLQGRENRKARNFAVDRYNVERQDSINDRDFENFYNSPAEKMKRLKEAGLNPNLVYDNQGANSATARGANTGTPSTSAPQIDTSGTVQSMFKYFDVKQQQAQTDLVAQQHENAMAENALIQANTYKTLASADETTVHADTGRFELGQKQRLADTQAEIVAQSLAKLKADTDYTVDNNARQEKLSKSQIVHTTEMVLASKIGREKTAQEIKESAARIANLALDGKLKELELSLTDVGLDRKDPWYIRMMKVAADNRLSREKSNDLRGSTLNIAPKVANDFTPSWMKRKK